MKWRYDPGGIEDEPTDPPWPVPGSEPPGRAGGGQ